MSLFACPLCHQPLTQEEHSYVCSTGHTFDKAKEGYVHLLPVNRMNSKSPGDDKEMVRARNRFLKSGYYDALRDALSSLAVQYAHPNTTLLDSGCGEGYYTQGITAALTSGGFTPTVAGIDIAKEAVRLASKGLQTAEFAVASAYHLPVGDASISLLLNCFSPLCLEEFTRVLKANGYFFYVVPAPRHLWSLKSAIYDSPYENELLRPEYDGFSYCDVKEVRANVTLPDTQTIRDLFSMTPYVWKTSKEGLERLHALNTLDVEIAFDIHVYQKQAVL